MKSKLIIVPGLATALLGLLGLLGLCAAGAFAATAPVIGIIQAPAPIATAASAASTVAAGSFTFVNNGGPSAPNYLVNTVGMTAGQPAGLAQLELTATPVAGGTSGSGTIVQGLTSTVAPVLAADSFDFTGGLFPLIAAPGGGVAFSLRAVFTQLAASDKPRRHYPLWPLLGFVMLGMAAAGGWRGVVSGLSLMILLTSLGLVSCGQGAAGGGGTQSLGGGGVSPSPAAQTVQVYADGTLSAPLTITVINYPDGSTSDIQVTSLAAQVQ